MLIGVDRLLKYYFDPPIITNMALKQPENPGSNLEFLGPSELYAFFPPLDLSAPDNYLHT